jgi:hypothetical protein
MGGHLLGFIMEFCFQIINLVVFAGIFFSCEQGKKEAFILLAVCIKEN